MFNLIVKKENLSSFCSLFYPILCLHNHSTCYPAVAFKKNQALQLFLAHFIYCIFLILFLPHKLILFYLSIFLALYLLDV